MAFFLFVPISHRKIRIFFTSKFQTIFNQTAAKFPYRQHLCHALSWCHEFIFTENKCHLKETMTLRSLKIWSAKWIHLSNLRILRPHWRSMGWSQCQCRCQGSISAVSRPLCPLCIPNKTQLRVFSVVFFFFSNWFLFSHVFTFLLLAYNFFTFPILPRNCNWFHAFD